MSQSNFGPRRCHDTRKPPASQCPDVVFYRCDQCGSLFPVTGSTCGEEKSILCCHKQAKPLLPLNPDTASNKMTFHYQITGGYNDNAVKVFWESQNKTTAPDWMYLKTFTDAFAYCDEDPCLECVFRCKRGFVIYIYEEETGLREIPLDKMNAHWESQQTH
jgi:hypothetical protein